MSDSEIMYVCVYQLMFMNSPGVLILPFLDK